MQASLIVCVRAREICSAALLCQKAKSYHFSDPLSRRAFTYRASSIYIYILKDIPFTGTTFMRKGSRYCFNCLKLWSDIRQVNVPFAFVHKQGKPFLKPSICLPCYLPACLKHLQSPVPTNSKQLPKNKMRLNLFKITGADGIC